MKYVIPIKGMHCRSCELLIESEIKKINGVLIVEANSKKGCCKISSSRGISDKEIKKAINGVGYEIGDEALPYVRLSVKDALFFLASIILIAGAYFLAKSFGLIGYFSNIFGTGSNILAVFGVGIAAGFSTCMALIGGLVLGVSARYAEIYPDAGVFQKFRPHIYFNLGRIFSFVLFGGVIGYFGSVVKLSSPLLGIFTLIVGLVLVILGLEVIGIFPRISQNFVLPKSIANFLGIGHINKKYSRSGTIFLGALTFFLPCGFTQAMQLYAANSGSILSGALIMSVFALGTTPGLFGLAGITSAINRGPIAEYSLKFIGLILIILSVYNINNGVNLLGIPKGIKNGIINSQTKMTNIESVYTPNDSGPTLAPNDFTVVVGQPVRLSIKATADGEGCMGSVMIPGLVNQPKFFLKNKTEVLEFMPKTVGRYKITCAMGVRSGYINVVNP